jgi:hypothetical protein
MLFYRTPVTEHLKQLIRLSVRGPKLQFLL